LELFIQLVFKRTVWHESHWRRNS